MGTFRATGSDVAGVSCDVCTAGFYCPYEGMDTPVACPQYMYCPVTAASGSIVPTPCIDGQLCDTATPTSQTVFTQCTHGNYCIKGMMQPCKAGYQCDDGSTTPIPTDAKSGVICPKGYYCEAGSSTDTFCDYDDGNNTKYDAAAKCKIPCPVGKYNSYEGATSESECKKCGQGETCTTLGLDYPGSSDCDAGEYCPSDGNLDTDPGYYSPQGVTVQLICPPGQYTSTTRNANCLKCTEGFYCFSTDYSVGPTS